MIEQNLRNRMGRIRDTESADSHGKMGRIHDVKSAEFSEQNEQK